MNDDALASARVLTVGHSDRTAEKLAELLSGARVSCVVDVRSHPWSRRHPWHGRVEMERSLARAGIEYVWMGGALGGMRAGGYAQHRETIAYRDAISELLKLAGEKRVAVLCAERDPWHCHRRFIADDLSQRGVEVRHLLDEDESAPHQPSLL